MNEINDNDDDNDKDVYSDKDNNKDDDEDDCCWIETWGKIFSFPKIRVVKRFINFTFSILDSPSRI